MATAGFKATVREVIENAPIITAEELRKEYLVLKKEYGPHVAKRMMR